MAETGGGPTAEMVELAEVVEVAETVDAVAMAAMGGQQTVGVRVFPRDFELISSNRVAN